MSLRDLYQEMILDHGKSPRNFGEMQEATHSQVGHNPLCGDQLTLYIQVKDEHIVAVSFKGKGCAISVASASLLTEAIKGKSIKIAEKLFADFHVLLTEGKMPVADLGKLSVFAGVSEFPMRVKCATLAWHTFKAALEKQETAVCTESAGGID